MKEPVMTARQRELARHALGLPNERARSYRNGFSAGDGHSDYADWLAMVEGGFAVRRAKPKDFGGSDVFHLTLHGAKRAIKTGETLDPEDFLIEVTP